MKEFYTAISEVYREVTLATPVVAGNPCGECRSCCTSAILRQNVTELELATMASHVGEASVARFRSYLARENDEHGSLLYFECPNLGEHGCTVHEYRPLSCRLYGHFRGESAELFEHCVFVGQETVFSDQTERFLSPGQVRMTELSLEYLSYFPGAFTQGHDGHLNDPQNDFEMAAQLQVEGRYQEAIVILKLLRGKADSANLTLMLAECYEALGDYSLAIDTLDEATLRSPRNAELYSRKGGNCLWSGRLLEAREALDRSLELAPDRMNALGMLGFVFQLQGDPASAYGYLSRAVELEVEPGPYRFQLALVLKLLGRVEDSRAMLLRAVDYLPTAGQANQALAEL